MGSGRVIVVGGGAAGLMAAGQAADAGADTLLLEKMDRPGRKLTITGKGRCNLTNVATIDDFVAHFGTNGRFLRRAFAQFFSTDLISFLESVGVPTVTERGGRVFPASGEARLVVEALVRWNKARGVEIVRRARVKRLIVEAGSVVGVQLDKGKPIGRQPATGPGLRAQTHSAAAVIVATGGASYPVPIRPALVPLETAGDVAAKLQGLSLRNVRVSVLIDGKKQVQAFGEMLFTHFGVSGPIILTLSGRIVDALGADHRVDISIDLKPALDEKKLDARLLRDLDAHGKRQFRTLLKALLPQKLIPLCIEQVHIAADRRGNQITSEERKRLCDWLKDFRLQVTGHRSLSAAIVTAGGVSTKEINSSTMSSRLVKGLYFAGEVLDIDADTGGYNLQAAFSTGWVAGRAAALDRS